MSLARNLSKFKPSSSGLIETDDIADDAVTTAKVDPAQTDITSVGTLSSATVSGDLTVDSGTLKVDSSNNKVGIGTTSPSTQLHIDEGNSNSYATIRLEGNNRGGDIEMYQGTVPVSTIRTDQSGNMYFKTSGAYGSTSLSNKIVLLTGGNVGIGTDSPTSPLGANFKALDINSGVWGGTVNFSGNSGGYIGNRHSGNAGLGYYSASGQGHDFHVNGNTTSVLNINSSGYVTKPSQPVLSLYGDTVRVQAGGQNSDTDVSFTERIDNTNSYDTANKYFDVPFSGKYLVNFYASVKSNTSYIMIKIKVGSTTEAISYGEEPNDGLDWVARSCQTILDLSAGDAVRFQLTTGSATSGAGQILESKYRGVHMFLLA